MAPNNIRDFFRVFLQMAVVLTFAGGSPVVKVGRIAGQFAKPRSSPTEKRGDVELPSYRGDIINGNEFTPEARIPDPRRQIEAYRQSAATLNLLRAFAHGGYANLATVHQWMLGFVKDSPQARAMQELADRISRGARLHARLRARPGEPSGTAHHRLLYQPRGVAARLRGGDDARRFDQRRLVLPPPATCSGSATARASPTTRMSSICRGIKNPIGMKCGPSLKPDELLELIDILNPDNEPGRLTLIGRFGARQGRRAPARADPRGQARRPQCGVVLRSDARQHHHGGRPATRRGRSTACSARSKEFFAVHARRRHLCRRRASRDDRPERHRMHRRRAGDLRKPI